MMFSIPEVSEDKTCLITYTLNKHGDRIAAHCTAFRQQRVKPQPTRIRIKRPRLIQGQSPLQRIQSLFA